MEGEAQNRGFEKYPWLKKESSVSRGCGNPSWKKGMKSPNPSGRPKGIIDKRTRITQVLMDDASDVARVVIESALAGDVQAASLVLSRVAPVLKSQGEKVEFEFDATASLREQVEYVLQAIANGELSPDTGKQLVDTISVLTGIKQVEELEMRLAALEGR